MRISHLSNHHRATVEKLFAGSGGVEWRELRSLLEAVGTVSERPNGKLEVTVGPETEVLESPHVKDTPAQTLIDVRRMLRESGLGPGQGAPAQDART
ncbi:MAG TPA: hypothetical protein VMG12_02325, partial [Polyangiaceae bacterium]|nr:hypothetical protein [Polyangiaceae bacterium]